MRQGFPSDEYDQIVVQDLAFQDAMRAAGYAHADDVKLEPKAPAVIPSISFSFTINKPRVFHRDKAQRVFKIADAIHIASKVSGLPEELITGPSRVKEIVGPRHYAMWLAYRNTKRSFPVIGRAFGGRDHTSVLHAVHKFEKLHKAGLVGRTIKSWRRA